MMQQESKTLELCLAANEMERPSISTLSERVYVGGHDFMTNLPIYSLDRSYARREEERDREANEYALNCLEEGFDDDYNVGYPTKSDLRSMRESLRSLARLNNHLRQINIISGQQYD